MFCYPVPKLQTADRHFCWILFPSNFTGHLDVTKKIEVRLFRSKALCSYNVLLSCPQASPLCGQWATFVTGRPVIHPTVPKKIALRLFRSKTVCSYNVLLSCSQIADCRQQLLLNHFPVKFYWSPRCSQENRAAPSVLYLTYVKTLVSAGS